MPTFRSRIPRIKESITSSLPIKSKQRRSSSLPPPERRSSFSFCFDSVEALFDCDAAINNGVVDNDLPNDGGIFLGGNHIGDRGAARIATGLEDQCRHYFKLYLCDNRIGPDGASLISLSLRLNTTLLELSLGNNWIGDEGSGHLASSLRFNETLEILNLENNQIGPTGAVALADALEQNSSLQWLVLSENPIGDVGAAALLRCIRNISSLDHLEQCNHSLLSMVLKKVTNVRDSKILREIQTFLKINRMSAPLSKLAAHRKITLCVNENPFVLLDYIAELRSRNAGLESGLVPFIFSYIGEHCTLSAVFVFLQNSPHLLSIPSSSQALSPGGTFCCNKIDGD